MESITTKPESSFFQQQLSLGEIDCCETDAKISKSVLNSRKKAGVIELSNTDARKYFLMSKNYVNFDLPDYFDFQNLIDSVTTKITGHDIAGYFSQKDVEGKITAVNPKDLEGVNYKVIGNKDGEFAWRQFEIINPVLYIALVNLITEESNWDFIKSRFNQFGKSFIKCESLPSRSLDSESDKAHQVQNWWHKVEKGSVKQALEYQYVIDADITDCYGSIYTHSIAWALHGKEKAKEQRDNKLIGNRIDYLIRSMRHGQTNGIPQGSSLMDFIAEMVLGYTDEVLSNKIKIINRGTREHFSIIRYRDDYKIFTNNPEFGKSILRELSIVLSSLGLKLNTQKTRVNNDPVLAAVKEDKIYELYIPIQEISFSKRLYQIYSSSLKFPNTGMVVRQLDKYYSELDEIKKLPEYEDLNLIISIVVNIALRNPRTHPLAIAILSKLIVMCTKQERKRIIKQIMRKFERVPNTGLLDIWLQRITLKISPDTVFHEPVTKVVNDEYNSIWNYEWLKEDFCKFMSNISFIDREIIKKMEPTISRKEVALFRIQYPW